MANYSTWYKIQQYIYIYIYTHMNTKRTSYYEFYLVCNGSISAAGGVVQPKVWTNNLLFTRHVMKLTGRGTFVIDALHQTCARILETSSSWKGVLKANANWRVEIGGGSIWNTENWFRSCPLWKGCSQLHMGRIGTPRTTINYGIQCFAYAPICHSNLSFCVFKRFTNSVRHVLTYVTPAYYVIPEIPEQHCLAAMIKYSKSARPLVPGLCIQYLEINKWIK